MGHPTPIIKLRMFHWMPREYGEHGFGENEQTWCKSLKFLSYIPGAPMTSMCWRSIVNPSKQRQKKHQPKQQGSFGFQVTIRCVEGRIWNTVHISFKLFFKEISWMESLHNSTKTPFGINNQIKKITFQLLPSDPLITQNGGDQQPLTLETTKEVTGKNLPFSPKKKQWLNQL